MKNKKGAICLIKKQAGCSILLKLFEGNSQVVIIETNLLVNFIIESKQVLWKTTTIKKQRSYYKIDVFMPLFISISQIMMQ